MTKSESIQDIGDINCFDSAEISHELTAVGIVPLIALVEERSICPKCYSVDIKLNRRTVRYITSKSQPLCAKWRVN